MEVAAGEQPCAGRQEGRKVHFAAEAPSPKGGPACTPGPAEDSWKVGAAGRWLPTAAACRGRRAPLQGRPHSLTPKRGPSQIAAGEASTPPPWSGTPLEDDCTPGSAAWLESARKVDDLRARLEGPDLWLGCEPQEGCQSFKSGRHRRGSRRRRWAGRQLVYRASGWSTGLAAGLHRWGLIVLIMHYVGSGGGRRSRMNHTCEGGIGGGGAAR